MVHQRSAWAFVAIVALVTGCSHGRTSPMPGSDCSNTICDKPQICVTGLGCVDCHPGQATCMAAQQPAMCDDNGHFVPGAACAANSATVCYGGQCVAACAAAEAERSNVGCEYWPVDLPQFCDTASALPACERKEDFAVMVANLNDYAVHVEVTRNDANVGAAPQIATVDSRDLPPRAVNVIVLPQREIDGSNNTDPENLSGVSARAYRLVSSGPVVAYQINTLAETDSIDASLLIPTASLAGRYRTVTAPSVVFDTFGLRSRNRAFVTIVGTAAMTHVHVSAGGHVVSGPGVADTVRGGMVDVTLGPFEVLHLAGTQTGGIAGDVTEGDLSTTLVEADHPVAVYSGHVCAAIGAPAGAPKPPGKYDSCCCDHLEEQVPPTTSLGTKFAVTRSPVRGKAGYVEPDVLRLIADDPGTTITTNLPPPWDHFTAGPDKVVELWTQTDFVLQASGPVLLAQLLVGQEWGAGIGDPSLTYLPPVEQARTDYMFLVPQTYSENYVVIGREVGTSVELDGMVAGAELGACLVNEVGMLDGRAYESVRCPLIAGVHTLSASSPVSLIEYGYGGTGSIAYVGGTDYRLINPIE